MVQNTGTSVLDILNLRFPKDKAAEMSSKLKNTEGWSSPEQSGLEM